MPVKITLHHLNSSRSDRIFWLLEELNLPYDVQVHFRNKDRSAPNSLKAVSHLGKAPAVVIEGKTLTESGFITYHIMKHHAALAPTGTKPEAGVELEPSEHSVFWSHWAEGTQMFAFHAKAVIGSVKMGVPLGVFGKFSEEEQKGAERLSDTTLGIFTRINQSHLDELENFLAEHPGKNFTGTDEVGQGDFMLYFANHALFLDEKRRAGLNIGPQVTAWHDRISARPACKRAVERMTKEETAAAAQAKM